MIRGTLAAHLTLRSIAGGPELVQQLKQDARLTANKSASEGLNDMGLLYTYLDIFGVSRRVRSSRAALSL